MTTATITDTDGKTRQINARVIQQVIGKRGLSIWGGFVREEYLTQIASWDKQARLFLEMRDDPTVGALLNAIKLPLLSAEVSVQAVSEDPADQQAARFLEANLHGMDRQTWRAYTEDSLEALDFGFALGEIVMEKRRDGYFWLKNIEPRGQETVRRWITQGPDSTEIIGFEQAPFRGSEVHGTIRVPLEKCVHIVYRGRKGNPLGRSLLRSIYTPYVFVKNLRTFEGIKIERDVGGTPVLTLPAGINDISSSEFDDLRDQLDGLKTDETLWVTIPEGMTLEPYTGAANTAGIRETIRDHQKDMLKVFFAQFLELGMDQAGTQALVKGSHDFFSLALEAVQHVIVEAWNQQLVPFLFQFNRFNGMTGLPEITWAPPGKSDLSNLLDLYRDGTAAKVITATRNDEVYLRDIADLPDLEEGEGEQDRSPSEPFMPFGARFAEHPAGQDLRTIPGIYEKFTNDYQRVLVSAYDSWAIETARLVGLADRTPADIERIVTSRLDQLRGDLKLLGRQRISEASGLGLGGPLGKHAQRAEVQRVIAGLISQNDLFIDDSLIPNIRERAVGSISNLPTGAKAQRSGLLDILATRRSRVAQTAGGAVVAIFEPQMAAGKIENAERRSRGEKPIPIRWVLDDRAEHCVDDGTRGTFGCENLARTYAGGWDDLPTVPAGNTSCLGNCRCQLYADFGNGFERIT